MQITGSSGIYKIIWNKVFKSGLSKFCGRQPLKNFKQTISLETS